MPKPQYDHIGTLLGFLEDIARKVNEARTVEQALQYVARRVCVFEGWRLAQTYRIAPDGSGEIVLTESWYPRGADQLERFRGLTTRNVYQIGEGLVGRVFETAEPLWLPDVRESTSQLHRRAIDFGLSSSAIFPIAAGDKVLAAMEFYSNEPITPDEETLSLIRNVGIQLGHFIVRKEMEREIATLTDRERRLIGQELHDSVGQQLTAMGYMARNLQRELEDHSAREAANAGILVENIEQSKSQIRALMKGLMPVDVDASGLMEALGELVDQCQTVYDVPCDFEYDEPVLMEDNFTATHLFRIVQEAIQNAIKHGQAEHITVGIRRSGNRVTLRIRDDGIGFDPAGLDSGGIGLRVMRHRAELIGAALRIASAESGGTVVRCTVEERR
ncbi:MAG: GAF domain-containing sensor histidine kinase [Gemmatimonadales bacterium]|jgi:signal transduction histidine kinase